MSQLLLMNTNKCHIDEYRYTVIFSLLITMKMSQLLLMNTDICHLLVTNHDEDVSITVDEYRYMSSSRY